MQKDNSFYHIVKRVFDVVTSFIGLIVLFVPLAIVALIIYIECPAVSPIYIQKRVGKNGREFCFMKFRTMIPDADKMLDELLAKNEMDGPVFKIENDPRITKFGRFLRKTGLDELPQLINVICGDMSLVGPRPPLPREVLQYDERHKQRLTVMPGITCYWQIQPKRNTLSFEQWIELDLKYIEERSLMTDIKILCKTVCAVIGMEGV